MRIVNSRTAAALLALGALALSATFSTAVQAQAPAVDPAATQILKRMTDYLDGLQRFSVKTQNVLEDLLDSGQRIDEHMTATVTVSRPDKLRAERTGDVVSQVFYYNGKTLTLYDPAHKVYATLDAPSTVERMLDFARDSLGLLIPAGDLVYRNSYSLLMQDVTAGILVGPAVVGGVKCNQVAFSRPGVDFQLWIPESGAPLPRKFAVTDTGTPARLTISVLMSDWNTAPPVPDSLFTFAPPQGAQPITFMRLDDSSTSSR
jgi:hypothetical protein